MLRRSMANWVGVTAVSCCERGGGPYSTLTESPEPHDMFALSWFPASGLSDDGRAVAIRKAMPLSDSFGGF